MSSAPKKLLLAVGLLGLVVALFASASRADLFSFFNLDIFGSKTPAFHEMDDVAEKKKAFFEFMYPLIEDANLVVLKRRALLENIHANLNTQGKLSDDDMEFVTQACEDYKVNCEQAAEAVLRELLKRVDVVPPSLVLAQAANESAWGTSRFAQQGNNFFGQWCFVEGCGLVPKARPAGATHEVKVFDDPYHSVRAYIRNINSTKAYNDLWKIRAAARAQDQRPTGLKLADGLANYSAREEHYVQEIKRMIQGNELAHYNTLFWEAAEAKALEPPR